MLAMKKFTGIRFTMKKFTMRRFTAKTFATRMISFATRNQNQILR